MELAKFAQKEEHSEADMAVVVILSHGVDGAVYGVDGALLPVSASCVGWAVCLYLGCARGVCE